MRDLTRTPINLQVFSLEIRVIFRDFSRFFAIFAG